jgi:hypothetical protein
MILSIHDRDRILQDVGAQIKRCVRGADNRRVFTVRLQLRKLGENFVTWLEADASDKDINHNARTFFKAQRITHADLSMTARKAIIDGLVEIKRRLARLPFVQEEI